MAAKTKTASAPAAPAAPDQTDAAALVNPNPAAPAAATTPIPSAVQVAEALTAPAAAPAAPAVSEIGFLVWNGFQYGVTPAGKEDTVKLLLAHIPDSRPKAGDPCQLKPPGEEFFAAFKIAGVTEADEALELKIAAA